MIKHIFKVLLKIKLRMTGIKNKKEKKKEGPKSKQKF